MNKRLYRSRTDTMVGGVAAGIAQYFEVDATIIRLLWLGSLLLHGSGLLLYVIAWLIVPLEPKQIQTRNAPLYVEKEAGESEQATVRDKVLEVARQASSEIEQHMHKNEKLRNNQYILGGIFIVAGVIFLLRNVFSWVTFDVILPLGLIAIGFVFITQGMPERTDRKDS